MGTHPIFESDFDCLTDVKMVLFSILIQDENDFDFDKEIFRHYKRMIDFNFTYLQEIINCYCAKKGRINDKTEDGKKDETLLVSRFTYIEESTVESDPSGNLD